MTREKAIEKMAMKIAELYSPKEWPLRAEVTRDHFRAHAAYALTALCAAIPGLGDVLAGTACIVPKEPTPEMMADGKQHLPGWLEHDASDLEHAGNVYAAMLSATPYKERTK